jgi:hypothetical protein
MAVFWKLATMCPITTFCLFHWQRADNKGTIVQKTADSAGLGLQAQTKAHLT